MLLDPPSPPPPLCEASYSGSTASTSVFNNFDSRQYLAYMDDDDCVDDGDEEEGHQQTRTTQQDIKKPNEKLQRRRQHNNIGSRIRGMAQALRQPAFIFGTPLLLSPLLFTDQKEHKCAFCVALMAVYWAGEVMPLAVTALLPLILFPMTGIMAAKVVAREFLNDTNFLFIGSLVMATAVQRCGLHERVALAVLSLVGSEPRLICLSFMAITATLSMFISNTATTAMMLPICQMICTLLSRPAASAHHIPKSSADSANGLLDSGSNISCQKQQNRPPPAPNQQRMTKGLILSICFAANIGGVGTLTGTPPNLVLVGMLATLYPGVDTSINFLSWMALTVPLMVACLLLCWLSLCLLFFQNIPPSDPQVNILLRKKNAELPPMSFAQKSVALCFFLLLLLWVGRSPGFMPGLGHIFPGDFYTDATSAMAIAILLFLLPAENPLNWGKAGKESAIPIQQQRLMDWPTMQEHFPWSVILLLGGGFALAAGVKESGLSELMARALSLLEQQPIWALQLICIVVTMMVTNICSNTVTASIFIPIVSSMAQRSSIHPLALMLPTTLACSFAFLLPVGTPPNAIVFSSGMLQVRDMIFSGLLVSSVVALTMIIYLANFVPLLMQIDRFPEWARLDTNETEIVESLLINIPQFEPVF